MIAGDHHHLATPAHHFTLGLLLMLDRDPTVVNTLLLLRESNTQGLFHLKRKGVVEKDHTHDHLLRLDNVHHLTTGHLGAAIEALLAQVSILQPLKEPEPNP